MIANAKHRKTDFRLSGDCGRWERVRGDGMPVDTLACGTEGGQPCGIQRDFASAGADGQEQEAAGELNCQEQIFNMQERFRLSPIFQIPVGSHRGHLLMHLAEPYQLRITLVGFSFCPITLYVGAKLTAQVG
jgi:hypothetical protein